MSAISRTIVMVSGSVGDLAVHDRSKRKSGNLWCEECKNPMTLRELIAGFHYDKNGKTFGLCLNCWRNRNERN